MSQAACELLETGLQKARIVPSLNMFEPETDGRLIKEPGPKFPYIGLSKAYKPKRVTSLLVI